MSGRRREETGAVALFVAVTVSLLVIVAAFAVDLGMQRVARRDMQALADVVALDLARSLGNRTVGELTAQSPSLQTLAEQSRARNDDTLGARPTLQVRVGELGADGDFRELTAPDAVPNAVEVTARTTVDYSFTSGEGGAVRSAVAVPEAVACISVGAVLATLNTSSSPLLVLLKGIVGADLEVLSPGGVADLQRLSVPLLAIATELEVGTVEELLELPGLTVGEFLVATASVLRARSGQTAGVTLLDELAKLAVGRVALSLAEILDLESGAESALTLDVGVFDLLQAALFVAGEGHAVAVPSLSFALPAHDPLVTISTSLSVVEPPQIACGPAGESTIARSAQIRLELTGRVGHDKVSDLDTTFLGSVVSKVGTIDIDLGLEAGTASATLRRIQCASGGPTRDRLWVDVATGAVRADADLMLDLLLSVVDAQVSVGPATVAQKAFTGQLLEFAPTPSDDRPELVLGSALTTLGLASLTPTVTTGLSLIDTILTPLVSLVVRPLLMALDAVATPLVNALTSLLGLDLAGAHVVGHTRPDCNFAKLRG